MATSEDVNSSSGSQLLHLVAFPFPSQGHFIPFLDLLHHLSLLLLDHRRLAITVVVTPANLPLLARFLSSTPSASPLVLPLSVSPDDLRFLPAGVEHFRDVPTESPASDALYRSLASLGPKIRSWAQGHANPPAALLSDFFLGWTSHLAAELGVPRIVFYSSGAFAVAAIDYLYRHPPPVANDEADSLYTFASLPSSPVFPYSHLPPFFRRCRGDEEIWRFAKSANFANASSWGAVINTFDALEGEYIAHLKRTYGHSRVWAVGPLSASGAPADRGGQSSLPVGDVAAWLDSCPSHSVIYVCFGSQFAMTEPQGRAIASALEESGIRFLWAICNGGAAAAMPLPNGFEERVAGRGLVVRGWVPQVEVLNHRATGAFVTHCGWNSALEALAAGVPMLAWPMEADQFFNSRLLVEDLQVAIRVGEGKDDVPPVDELAKMLADSVSEGGAWPALRTRAAKLCRSATEAMGEGGSTCKDLKDLVKELCCQFA